MTRATPSAFHVDSSRYLWAFGWVVLARYCRHYSVFVARHHASLLPLLLLQLLARHSSISGDYLLLYCIRCHFQCSPHRRHPNENVRSAVSKIVIKFTLRDRQTGRQTGRERERGGWVKTVEKRYNAVLQSSRRRHSGKSNRAAVLI